MVSSESPIESSVETDPDVRIPVDGETVAATRYEPVDTDGPSPGLLMYIPYHKDDWITYGAYDPLIRYLAGRGFEVVVADMVGTGASTGHIEMMFDEREGNHAAAIVEWLADRPWTTGRVGMFGKSYGGITTLWGASQRPDGLEAIVPIETPYRGYRNAFTNGGLFELETIGMHWLTLLQVLDVKPPSRRTGNWAEVWEQRLESARSREPWLASFLEHPNTDGYWEGTDIPVDRIQVPTLAVGGWQDPYTIDTFEYARAIEGPVTMLLGPWRHTMPHRGNRAAIDFRPRVADWFDHHLRDVDTGVESWPAYTVWTDQPESDGGGRWRGLDAWATAADSPSDRYEITSFALGPDGVQTLDSYSSGPLSRTMMVDHTVGLESVTPYDLPVDPQDTAGDDRRSMCFETEPLSEPLDVTGSGTAELRLKTTMDDPVISVRVVDVSPDGGSRLVTHGTVRAGARDGIETDANVPRDQKFAMTVPLEPRSYVFEQGHRIRIAVAGALFPAVMPRGGAGSIDVLSAPDDPSVIQLPVRSIESTGFDDTVDLGTPLESPSPVPERASQSRGTWETGRERTQSTGTVIKRVDNTVDLPHATMYESGTYTARVGEDDSRSFVSENDLTFRLEYDTTAVTIEATNRFTTEEISLETRVEADETVVFDESWTRFFGDGD